MLSTRSLSAPATFAGMLALSLLISCSHRYDPVEIPRHAPESEKARIRKTLGEQQNAHPTDAPEPAPAPAHHPAPDENTHVPTPAIPPPPPPDVAPR